MELKIFCKGVNVESSTSKEIEVTCDNIDINDLYAQLDKEEVKEYFELVDKIDLDDALGRVEAFEVILTEDKE